MLSLKTLVWEDGEVVVYDAQTLERLSVCHGKPSGKKLTKLIMKEGTSHRLLQILDYLSSFLR